MGTAIIRTAEIQLADAVRASAALIGYDADVEYAADRQWSALVAMVGLTSAFARLERMTNDGEC